MNSSSEEGGGNSVSAGARYVPEGASLVNQGGTAIKFVPVRGGFFILKGGILRCWN